MPMELKPIEGGRMLQQLASGRRHQLLFEMGDSLAKWQIEEQLDKANQVTAPATPVAIEQILAGIDVEGRASLRM
jgi:hypothetical protein